MAVEEGGGGGWGFDFYGVYCMKNYVMGKKKIQLETSHKRVLCKFACLPLKTFNNNEYRWKTKGTMRRPNRN